MPLDTFSGWPAELWKAEARVVGEDAGRDKLLRQARRCIERVVDDDRWGMSAMDYADQAAELLRRAGLHELAEECSDSFGIDTTAVLAEIDRELQQCG